MLPKSLLILFMLLFSSICYSADNVEIYQQAGQYFRSQLYQKALTEYQQLYSDETYQWEARYQSARCFYLTKQNNKAIELLDVILNGKT